MTTSPSRHDDYKKKRTNKKTPKTLIQDKFYTLDKHARKTPKQYEESIQSLTQYLIQPTKSEIEKARVLFTWIATHIKYDDNAYNTDVFPEYTAEYVLSNKKAVCEGYSNLMVAMCKEAGLESEKVTGYAKGYGYTIGDKFTKTDHAWNAVKIDNEWHLFDVTWASGYGITKNDKLVSISKFEPFWFDVHPKAFIFTHLPEQAKWQLTGNPLTLSKYEDLPYLSETFFKLGFSPNKIFSDAISGKTKFFAEVFPTDYPFNSIDIPYSQNLIRDKEVKFIIHSDYAEEIALIDGNSWYSFSKENNVFTLSYKPIGAYLDICMKVNSFDKNFSTFIKYNVVDNELKTVANTSN